MCAAIDQDLLCLGRCQLLGYSLLIDCCSGDAVSGADRKRRAFLASVVDHDPLHTSRNSHTEQCWLEQADKAAVN